MVGTMGALTAAGAKATVQGTMLNIQQKELEGRVNWARYKEPW